VNWIIYAIVAAIGLATADVCLKLAGGRISNGLGLVIYGSCTFSMGLGWFLWERFTGVVHHAQAPAVLASVGVGVSFCLVTAALYATFGAGAPISLASPFIRLGGLLVASIAGLMLWGEPLTPRYAIGMLLACGGVWVIITR
jgi:drug/metabolite transporter (DMT)-like permease